MTTITSATTGPVVDSPVAPSPARPATVLSAAQLRHYERDGFLVLRNQIPDHDIERLERAVDRNPPLDGTLDPTAPVYPAAGRYTLALNCLKDPDLAFLAEHPAILAVAADVLGDDPRLTAYVIYDRTPGGNGLPIHNDYKRWRPVGSSQVVGQSLGALRCRFRRKGRGREILARGSVFGRRSELVALLHDLLLHRTSQAPNTSITIERSRRYREIVDFRSRS